MSYERSFPRRIRPAAGSYPAPRTGCFIPTGEQGAVPSVRLSTRTIERRGERVQVAGQGENLSGGDFTVSGTAIKLSLAGTRDIEDMAGNVLAVIAPTGADENTFVIDIAAPALTSIAGSRSMVRRPTPKPRRGARWRYRG